MTQLTLAASNPGYSQAPAIQWTHDIRNALATIGLHLETLERLAGPHGGKAASAALALVNRSATMCADALAEAHRQKPSSRRRSFDLVKTIAEVVKLLEPLAPAGLEFITDGIYSCFALGDQAEIFRIFFNLAQNAVVVARAGAPISQIRFSVARSEAGLAIRVSDDGPGLPKTIKAKLFHMPTEGRTNGFGLAIARELAERNGGGLSLLAGAVGTTFLLELPSAAGIEIATVATMPSLGRRIAG